METFQNTLLQAGRAQLNFAYGDRPRNRLDLSFPKRTPRGLVVFMHGGFWLRLDKSH